MAKSEWKINPQRLRHLLESKRGRFSQADLAGELDVDKGTISRWMRGVTAISPTNLDKLCKILGVERDDLCNNEPITPEAPEKPQPDKRQMNVVMDDACRNALYLVSRRYNVRMQYILAAAPLMFYILAEQSLKARREKIEKLAEAREKWREAIPTYFPLSTPSDTGAEMYEGKSIQARDLFGDLLFSNLGIYYPNIPGDFDESDGNPFARYLSDRLSELDESDWATVSWLKDGSPRYQVCAKDVSEMVGGDTVSANLILLGIARLHQIQDEVGNANGEQVVNWIRSRFADLYDLFDKGITEGKSDQTAENSDGGSDA